MNVSQYYTKNWLNLSIKGLIIPFVGRSKNMNEAKEIGILLIYIFVSLIVIHWPAKNKNGTQKLL